MHRRVLVRWRQARHDGNAGEVNTDCLCLYSLTLSLKVFILISIPISWRLNDCLSSCCRHKTLTQLTERTTLTVRDIGIDKKIFMRQTQQQDKREDSKRLFPPSRWSLFHSILPSRFLLYLVSRLLCSLGFIWRSFLHLLNLISLCIIVSLCINL